MNTMVKTRINTGVLHGVHLFDKKNTMVFKMNIMTLNEVFLQRVRSIVFILKPR